MSDDLRTRIITAMLSEDDVALMADAVIAELGLYRESMLDGIGPVDDPPPWRDALMAKILALVARRTHR